MIALSTIGILFLVVLIGLVFTLTNGFHDASAVVATFISSGAATPKQAIGVASIFGLLGAIFGGNQVADTISKVIDLPPKTSLLVILFAAILGATAWNLITWKLRLPSSSTHALIGGIIGAVIISSGYRHILWGWGELIGANHRITGIVKVVAALFLSPLIGFAIAFILEKISKLLLRNAKFSVNKWISRMQWVVTACLSYTQRANDTQKVMGILTLALAAAGGSTIGMAPLWARVCGGLAMSIGTIIGGWAIMKTIGRGISDIKPIHSLNSQLASAGSVILANMIGAPVSTTHVVVGSVMGVSAADEYRMVHWGIAKKIFIAWFITIPFSAIASALIYTIFNLIFKVV